MDPRRLPFTIALPVRNGGSYLQGCVESILAQRGGDFALAILDNASDDEGAEFLRGLRDERVTVYRSERPLSIEDNWARILQIPKQEFLTTIGHDDLLDPDYLEVMRDLIRQHPDAGLYQAHFRLIDPQGRVFCHCNPMPARETAAEFLAARLDGIRDSFGTGYVMRSADFDRVGGLPKFERLIHSDDALWLRLMENSWKATSPREVFSYRFHEGSTSGGLDPAIYLDVLAHYETFLRALGERDPAIAATLTRYWPGFLAKQAQHLHHRALYSALAGTRPYPSALRARMPEWLRAAEAAGWTIPDRGKKVRLLEMCLRHPLGGSAYRATQALGKSVWNLAAPLLPGGRS